MVHGRSRAEVHDAHGSREILLCAVGQRHEADREYSRAERRKR
jgi:hypothetical protein